MNNRPRAGIFVSSLVLATVSALGQHETRREFPASPGQTLVLNLETGAGVRVTGWDQSLISVGYESRGGSPGRVEFNQTAEGLEIRTSFEDVDEEEVDRAWVRSWSRHSRMEFEIRVPRQFDIDLDSMGGGLAISDVEGLFTGKTMGGALTLDNVSGEARLTTMGGQIELTDSELDGSLKTMGGKVLFRNVVGDVKGSSMGGNVSYQNVRRRSGEYAAPKGAGIDEATADTVQISTMGGQIEVDEAPEGASVSTMGGDIEVSQASRFVKAKTMGGDIFIREVDGWVKATTMGGDIEVTVIGSEDGRDRRIDLESMSGDVSLTVPADLSMDFDLQISFTPNSYKDFRIISDFDMNIEEASEWQYRDGWGRKTISGSGSVAGGRHKVRVRTVNGNIRVRKNQEHR